MASIMDLVTQAMGGDATKQIGRQLGADEGSTNAAISTALPVLLAALAKNASSPEGAQALHGALERDHDGSILNDLGGYLGNASQGPGGPGADILRHVLGGQQAPAQQAIAGASGLDSSRSGQLLAMLAPIVMGALGKAQRQTGADAAGVARILGGERQHLEQAAPDMMGIATKLLDKDGDGSIVNELGGIAGKLFGRKP